MSSSELDSSYRSIFNPNTLARRGLCPVTKIRHQAANPLESHNLYFEQHGNGPEKILFIMGYMRVKYFFWNLADKWQCDMQFEQ
jgi:hypothetical protein